MLNVLFAPDWDALTTQERQTHVGRVFIGDWPYAYPLRDDTDRVFIDLLADSPVSEWNWFYDTKSSLAPTEDALRERVLAILASRSRPPVSSFDHIDFKTLDVRIRATASLILAPSYLHPKQQDAFILSTSIFPSLPAPRRPRHLAEVPVPLKPPAID